MKKIICVVLALCMLFVLAACEKPFFMVDGTDGRIFVSAENADANASGKSDISLAEGQKIEIQADLTGDSVIRIEVRPADADEQSEPVFWGIFSTTDGSSFSLPAGDYTVFAMPQKGATGSLTIQAIDAVDANDQNPVMNFVGEYQCDRAQALVECIGSEDALITIDWGGSARELARWTIIGSLDTETLTLAYTDCTKSILRYDDGGELESEELEYEDGTGTIVFHTDGSFTWHEDQSEYGEDMVFEWLPVAED